MDKTHLRVQVPGESQRLLHFLPFLFPFPSSLEAGVIQCPGNDRTGGGGTIDGETMACKAEPLPRWWQNHKPTNKPNNAPHGCHTWRENEFAGFDKGHQGAFSFDRYN